jgi:hypothetical protein
LVTSEKDFQGPSWGLFGWKETASLEALVESAVSFRVAARAGLGEFAGCCAWALMAPHPARNTPRNHRAD